MRLLVVAAHVDDEALLCGGTLHKLRCRGHEATVAFCTRNEQGSRREETGEARRQRIEAEAVASALRLGFEPRFLGFEDMRLADAPGSVLQSLVQVIRASRPELVITHSASDWHIDHRAIGGLVPEAALQAGYPVMGGADPWRTRAVLHGQVDLEGLTAFVPQLVSRLSDEDIAAKLEVVGAYESITADHDVSSPQLRQSLEQRAALRGRSVGAAAGEGFALSPLLQLDAAALRLLAEVLE